MQPRGAKSSPACAVCKYQRRKCGTNCPLAEYFPAHLYRDFLHAHRLFGVSNIVKMTANLNPHEKKMAMNSIVFQANARASDPVGGCFRIICNLQREVEFVERQLGIVRAQIEELRRAQIKAEGMQGMAAIDDDDLMMFDGGIGRAAVMPVEYRGQGIRVSVEEQKKIVGEDGFGAQDQRVYKVLDERSVKDEIGESSSSSSGRLPRGFADQLGGFSERLN